MWCSCINDKTTRSGREADEQRQTPDRSCSGSGLLFSVQKKQTTRGIQNTKTSSTDITLSSSTSSDQTRTSVICCKTKSVLKIELSAVEDQKGTWDEEVRIKGGKGEPGQSISAAGIC